MKKRVEKSQEVVIRMMISWMAAYSARYEENLELQMFYPRMVNGVDYVADEVDEDGCGKSHNFEIVDTEGLHHLLRNGNI